VGVGLAVIDEPGEVAALLFQSVFFKYATSIEPSLLAAMDGFL